MLTVVRGSAVLLLALTVLFDMSVRAQSLADVARKEQERRNAILESGKVYTNKDLQPVPAPPGPPPADAGKGDTQGTAPAGGAPSGVTDTASQKDDKDAKEKSGGAT